MSHAELLRLLKSLPGLCDDTSGLSAADRAFLERMRLRVAANEMLSQADEQELVRIAQGWSDCMSRFGIHTSADACVAIGIACVLAVLLLALFGCTPALVNYAPATEPPAISFADRQWMQQMTQRINALIACSDVQTIVCVDEYERTHNKEKSDATR
jgi:hypothetical protein